MSNGRIPVAILTFHVALITVVLGFLAVALRGPMDGNIGAGMAMLALGAMGLPWSLLVFLGVIPEARDFAETALFATFALGSVLVHGLLAMLLTRSGPKPPATASPGISPEPIGKR